MLIIERGLDVELTLLGYCHQHLIRELDADSHGRLWVTKWMQGIWLCTPPNWDVILLRFYFVCAFILFGKMITTTQKNQYLLMLIPWWCSVLSLSDSDMIYHLLFSRGYLLLLVVLMYQPIVKSDRFDINKLKHTVSWQLSSKPTVLYTTKWHPRILWISS